MVSRKSPRLRGRQRSKARKFESSRPKALPSHSRQFLIGGVNVPATPGLPLPTPRSGLAYALYQSLILMLGGELAPNTFPENEAYDPKTKSWKTLAPMPGGRHGTGAAVTEGRVYIAGGSLKPGSGEVTNQLIVFNLP